MGSQDQHGYAPKQIAILVEELSVDQLAQYSLQWMPAQEIFEGGDPDTVLLCFLRKGRQYWVEPTVAAELDAMIRRGASRLDVLDFLCDWTDGPDDVA